MNMCGWSGRISRKETFLLRVQENREKGNVPRRNLSRYSVPRMPAICLRESRNQGSRQNQARIREATINAGKISREKTEETQGV